MNYIKMFEAVSDSDGLISVLQKNARSKDTAKAESAKKALTLKPTALFLHAMKNGMLYQDKGYNKAASAYDPKSAEDMQAKLDKAIYDASEALGLSVKAKNTWGDDSKKYAEAYLKYLKLQDEESKLWNQFVLKLGHFPNREVKVLSDELKTVSDEGLRKVLPMWPKRWLTELKKGNPPTGDPSKRSDSIQKMEKILDNKKKEAQPEEQPIGLDDSTPDPKEVKATPKLRKANRVKAVKPEEKEKEEQAIDDLLSSDEPVVMGKEPKPSASRIFHYKNWSDENLIKLATETGIPHKDRNAARKILTDRGIDGYPEPDYEDVYTPDKKNDPEGNGLEPDKEKEDVKEPEKKEIPMTVTHGDEEPAEDNSIIPKGTHLDQITGGQGPIDKRPEYKPTHENPYPCRVCGRPKDDPCHQQAA